MRAFLFRLPVLLIAAGCSSGTVTQPDLSTEPVYERVLRDSVIRKRVLQINVAQKIFSIEDLFLLSLDRTEQLAIAAERATAADARIRRSYGAWLPRMSLVATQYAPLSPGFAVPGLRFAARQNIMTGLNEYTGIVGARLERVAEEQSLRAEMAAHLLNIADAALQFRLSVQLAHEARAAVRLTESSLAEIRRRVALGRNKRGDALKTEARLRQKQADLLAAEERQAQWKRHLQFLTGYPDEFEFDASTLLFAADEVDAASADLGGRSDIALGKTLVSLRKNEVAAADGAHLPNIYLDGSYRPPLEENQRTSYFGGIVAELPLFQGGQLHENQKIARSRLRQAELELSLAERRARTELADALEGLRKAKAEKAAYAASAVAAEKNYAAQLADMRLSLATILEVLQSMEDLQGARIAQAQVEYREAIAQVRFFVATGRLFTAQQ